MVWWREATQQNTGSRRSLTSRVHSPDFSLLRRQEILLFRRDSSFTSPPQLQNHVAALVSWLTPPGLKKLLLLRCLGG